MREAIDVAHTVSRLPLQMTLVDIARLAQVQRPVVSMWRSRSATSDTPFPPPVATVRGEERFDSDAIVAWLEHTGRGNNPDARDDVAGYASPMGLSAQDDAVVFHGLGALLCLREIAGARLTDLPDDELLDLADDVDPDDEFLSTEIETLGDRRGALAGYADSLADAAYHGAAAFERLMEERFRLAVPGHTAVTLHERASELAASLAAALVVDAETEPVVYVDPTAGGSELLVALVRGDEGLGSATVMTARGGDTASRHARRRLRVHGVHCLPLVVDDEGAWAVPRPAVHLAQYPSPGAPTMSAEEILSAVENIVLQMDDTHRAVVLGPSGVLADRVRDRRPEELRDALLRQGRVRAIVRLPRGLLVTRPGQALALWVLGPAHHTVAVAQRWTTIADLTDVELDDAAIGDLVSDLVAAMGGRRTVDAHAFRFGRRVATRTLLAGRGDLVDRRQAVTPRAPVPTPQLAMRIAEITAALRSAQRPPDVIGVEVHDAADDERGAPPTTLGQAISTGHLRLLAGNRLDTAALPAGPVHIIGAEELTGAVRPGSRGVDRLAFETAQPSGRYTEPGDIVFCTAPRPAALVDVEGGSIAVAPARVLRIDATSPGGLLPEVLAADINAEPAVARGWRGWPARPVPATERDAVSAALSAVARQRTDARERLALLDELEQLVVRGVARGSLSLTTHPDTQPKEGR
ncbi:MAG: hypothetical protein GEU83_17385 [Pseudonocardiaceae bacterium]|nr:hypothetical protein [Pseudonocardiaceae bacterium]